MCTTVLFVKSTNTKELTGTHYAMGPVLWNEERNERTVREKGEELPFSAASLKCRDGLSNVPTTYPNIPTVYPNLLTVYPNVPTVNFLCPAKFHPWTKSCYPSLHAKSLRLMHVTYQQI